MIKNKPPANNNEAAESSFDLAASQAASQNRRVRPISTLEVPERPALAPNVQLVGELQESGFENRQWLIERDDQFIQLTELLYRVLEQLDGERTLEEIAARVTEETDWIVNPEHVRQIIQTKLIPIGLVVSADGAVVLRSGVRASFGVKNVKVLGPRIIDPITKVLQFLYVPPIFVLFLILMSVAHGWLYFMHGMVRTMHEVIYLPGQLLMLLVLFLIAGVFHEFGHASALRYGGGKVREMGAGIYLVFPIFYTDTTDSYRLDRWARLRTDIGGFYFELIFALVCMALYFVTRQAFFLAVMLLTDVQIITELSPLVRFDGYWALADLMGIPDLFSYMGPFVQGVISRVAPFLRGILPILAPGGNKLLNLKPWVKVIFMSYIIVTIIALPVLLFFLVMYEPTIVSTTWSALLAQRAMFAQAKINGDPTVIALSNIQALLLALPLFGNMYLLFSLVKKGWNWSKQNLKRAIVGSLFAAGIIAVLAFLWAPQLPQLPSFASGSTQNFKPVDGITCDQGEHATEHIHAHLAIYMNGQAVLIPSHIGIPAGGNCLYWLHTHRFDGVIHVEAPSQGTYTVGQFIDIWTQTSQTPVLTNSSFLDYPLDGHQLHIWTSDNGKPAQRYIGNLGDLALQNHEIITIAYDSPHVRPVTYFDWRNSSAGG